MKPLEPAVIETTRDLHEANADALRRIARMALRQVGRYDESAVMMPHEVVMLVDETFRKVKDQTVAEYHEMLKRIQPLMVCPRCSGPQKVAKGKKT